VDALMKKAMDAMKQQGAELVELDPMKDHDQWSKADWTVLVYEFKNDLNKYLAEHPEAPRKNLKELIEFNKKNSSKELQWFDQSIFITAEEKTPSEEEYMNALKLTKTLPAKYIDGAMKEHNLNALIAPTNGPSWTIDRVNGDHFGGGSSDLAAVSGYPSITVPAGFVHELPIGLSFIGTAWSEPELIKVAYSFEQATKLRQAPKFIPSLLTQMGFRG
jgi:amidase